MENYRKYLIDLVKFTENTIRSIGINAEVYYQIENKEWTIISIHDVEIGTYQRYHYCNNKLPKCDLQHESLYLANQFLERRK